MNRKYGFGKQVNLPFAKAVERDVVRRPSLNATGLPSPSRVLGYGALFYFAGSGRPAAGRCHNGGTTRYPTCCACRGEPPSYYSPQCFAPSVARSDGWDWHLPGCCSPCWR
jgi:hypothetical protein